VAGAHAAVEVAEEDEEIYPCPQGRSDSHNCGAPEMPSPEIFLPVSWSTTQDDLQQPD